MRKIIGNNRFTTAIKIWSQINLIRNMGNIN